MQFKSLTMKYLLPFLIIFSLPCIQTNAQVIISEKERTPEPSAALEIFSTNRGFLPPRMNRTEMLSITMPAEGLMVYLTDEEHFAYYDGEKWRNTKGEIIKNKVGDYAHGGIVFWISNDQTYGLVCPDVWDFNPYENQCTWGCPGLYIGSTDNFNGQLNTEMILNACPEVGIAASICANFEVNGYTDWFLPSIFELSKFSIWVSQETLGNYWGYFWSSTEDFSEACYGMWISPNSNQNYSFMMKENFYYVIPVRKFYMNNN